MAKSQYTKRALWSSIVALIACVAMLVGATFAWFTDTASTGVNKIVAGNLKVGFQYWNGEKYVDAKDATLFSEDTLWEPGHTEVVYLKVSNEGNLALKYRLNTINTYEYQYAKNSNGDKISLSDYLKIGVAEGVNAKDGTYASRKEAIDAVGNNFVSYDSYTKDSTLLPATSDNSTDYIAFVVYMPTNVGNEANWDKSKSYGAPWIRFNLAVNATQVDYENDSFDNTYDKDVPYPLAGVDAQGTGDVIYDELEKHNPSILLGADAARSYGWFVRYATTINPNGHTLSTSGNQALINVEANGDLTLTGNGTYDASGARDDATTITINRGGKLTIESGTFIGKDGNTCIYNAGGTVEIKGGTFKGDPQWTLNCQDGSGCVITVTGGTFYKFDPSNANVGEGEIVVPDGYKVVQDGDWYSVVAE